MEFIVLSTVRSKRLETQSHRDHREEQIDLFQRQVAQVWSSAKRHLRLLKMESFVASI